MARHRIEATVAETINAPDRPVHGIKRRIKDATATITVWDTADEPVIYSTRSGSTALDPPFLTDDEGHVIHTDSDELWIDPPTELQIHAEKHGKEWDLYYPVPLSNDQRVAFDIRKYGASCNAVVDTDGTPISGEDDTDAILDAIQAIEDNGGGDLYIPGSTFLSDLALIPANGQILADGGVSIYALEAAAGIQFGGLVGEAETNHGRSRFAFDGCAVSTEGVVLNSVSASYDIVCSRVDGDGVRLLGQNNLLTVDTADHNGNALALDNGTGGNRIYGRAHSSTLFGVELRRSAAPTAGAYAVPEDNNFYGFIAERAGSPTFGTTGDGLGNFHQTAGAYNRLHDPNFYCQNPDAPCILLEPDGVASLNGRLLISGGVFTGVAGGASTVGAIECDAVSGGVAGAMNSDIVVTLGAPITFSGFLTAIKWGSTSPLVEDSHNYDGNRHTRLTCPDFWTPNGTSAEPFATVIPPEDSILANNDGFIGRNLRLGNTLYSPEIATPSAPSANYHNEYTHDDGAGNTERVIRFATGLPQPIAREGATSNLVIPKIADETVNNSTALQDDDHLKFPIAANEIWFVQLIALMQGVSLNADIKFDWALPSGGTGEWQYASSQVGVIPSSAGATQQSTGTVIPFGLNNGSVFAQALALITNSSTAGTAQLRWAQNTLTAEDVKLRKGSHLILRRIA